MPVPAPDLKLIRYCRSQLYYYNVDPTWRSSDSVAKILRQRQGLGPCGCVGLEFDSCVKLWLSHNCGSTFFTGPGLQPQWDFFCMPKERNCTVDIAAQRMLSRYDAIGTTATAT